MRITCSTSLLVSAACTSHTYMPLETAATMDSQEISPETDPAFSYGYEDIPFTNHIVGQGATEEYTLRELVLPSAGVSPQGDREIRAKYYRTELPGPRPLVIVLPIYARFTYPSEKVGTFVQRHSDGEFHVLEVEGKNFLVNWYAAA